MKIYTIQRSQQRLRRRMYENVRILLTLVSHLENYLAADKFRDDIRDEIHIWEIRYIESLR